MDMEKMMQNRRKRKRVIILSDLFSAFIALLFSLSIGEGINLYLCLFVLAARSAASGLQTPAVESAIPLIAGSDNLKRANGMKGLLSSVVMLLSPVLAGILLPALQNARKRGISASCISRLKQVGIYAFNYASDNNDLLLPPGGDL